MNFKKTLILAGVLIVAIMYLTKVSEPRRQAELSKEKLFSSLERSTIARFEVLPRESASYALVKSSPDVQGSAEWVLADVPAAKLDVARLNGILTSLKSLAFEGPISDSELGNDFSVYGLDKPALTISMQLADENQKEIAFGKKSEYLSKRYTKVSGLSGIYLVDESGFQSLNHTRSAVRSKQPAAFNKADVREVVLESSGGRVVVTQPAVGEWQVSDSQPHEASKQDVERLLSDVQALAADEFIDGGEARLSDFGLDKPIVTMSVTLRDGLKERFIRVLVGEGSAGTFFTYDGAPSVFKVAPEKALPLRKSVIDLREKRLLKIGGGDLDKVVSGGSADSVVEIQAAAMDWTVNGRISDPVFVEELLNDIANISAVDFPKVVPKDAFTTPFLTLTLTKKGSGKGTVSIVVGKETSGPQGAVRYVRVGEQGEVAFIRDVEAKRIVPHENALIQRPTPAASTGQRGEN